jgi:hypothetical protein
MLAPEQHPTFADYVLPCVYSAEIVRATTEPLTKKPMDFRYFDQGSYRREGLSWSQLLNSTVKAQTETLSGGKLIIGRERPEDAVVSVVAGFVALRPGWDGEGAPCPTTAAIDDAIRFLRSAPALSAKIDPTIHANGAILFELEQGGALEFRGDRAIRVSLPNHPPTVLPFEGAAIPASLRHALSS